MNRKLLLEAYKSHETEIKSVCDWLQIEMMYEFAETLRRSGHVLMLNGIHGDVFVEVVSSHYASFFRICAIDEETDGYSATSETKDEEDFIATFLEALAGYKKKLEENEVY